MPLCYESWTVWWRLAFSSQFDTPNLQRLYAERYPIPKIEDLLARGQIHRSQSTCIRPRNFSTGDGVHVYLDEERMLRGGYSVRGWYSFKTRKMCFFIIDAEGLHPLPPGKPKMLRRFFRTLLARVKWKWSVEQENASSVPELEPLTVP